jgi:23S rRNA (uridine2552-2'-O)-methyltransferase
MKVSNKSSKVNRAWLNDHVNDTYVKLAKKEGYRARAAYKLQEIDETFRLIKPGDLVVDLGSAPGAWSQYARRRMSPRTATGGGAAVGALNGRIIALDMLSMEPVEGVLFLQGDFREDDVMQRLTLELQGAKVDLVVSDMAPNLSGIESADSARIEHLVELALEFATAHIHDHSCHSLLEDIFCFKNHIWILAGHFSYRWNVSLVKKRDDLTVTTLQSLYKFFF